MSQPSAVGPPAVRRVSGVQVIIATAVILIVGLAIGLVAQAQPAAAKVVSAAATAGSLAEVRSGERASTTPLQDRVSLAEVRSGERASTTPLQDRDALYRSLIQFRAGERELRLP